MSEMTLHRGRLIDHLQLVVRELPASQTFYAAVLGALGFTLDTGKDHFNTDELWVSTASSQSASGQLTGRHHLAFQAKDRAAVEKAYAAGIAAGGKDNGKPGERPYHPGYFAGFLLDPDGNNIEVVFHGPSERTASSVEISFPS